MLNYTYTQKILNGFFDRDVKPNRNAAGELVYNDAPIEMDTNERNIYIGLFAHYTDVKGKLHDGMPDNFGAGGREPGYYANSNDENSWTVWPEYSRIQLNCRSRIDKQAENLSLARMDGSTAKVVSQEMLLFPEAYGDRSTDLSDSEAGWGTISGFGLYYARSKDDPDAELFLWGTITGDGGRPVVIERFQVPVIRQGGLTISLQ